MGFLTPEIWQAIGLSLALASVTTGILLLIGVPLAYGLARWQSPLKHGVAALLSLPLVLPPTVLGFYLLLFLGPSGPGGALAALWGLRTLAFSFIGLVIGSVLYSLPFMIQPIRDSFEAIGPRPLEVAATLRASPFAAFRRVALPLALPGIFTGALLTFAHTLGEFGVVLMIGGNIPGQTRTLSIALFDLVETGNYALAHRLAACLVGLAFVLLLALRLLQTRWNRTTP